jgi:hypothetical protein
VRCFRVFDNVVDHFLDDPVELQFGLSRKP